MESYRSNNNVNLLQAMNKLTERKTKERAENMAREKELSKVKINKEDG